MERNKKKLKYETPLHIACKKGYINLVKLLLNTKGININSLSYTRDTFHFTPLHAAVSANRLEIVELLLNYNNINVNGKSVEVNYEFRNYAIYDLIFYLSNLFFIFLIE